METHMKLYEVNQEIESLLEALEPDPETGEIPANEDANVLGVTATPDRGDMRNLGRFFDSRAYEYTMGEIPVPS